MKFGPAPTNRLPQQDPEKVLRMAQRFQAASWAQARWAEGAREGVDFFEGRQYTEAQKAAARKQKRPHYKFNVIRPIVSLVIGYQAANKTDITFEPSNDALSSEEVAKVLSQLEKAIASGSGLEFVDAEVFLDGLISGRGWYDTRLSWEKNEFGEAETTSLDNFSVYPDPDASSYDLNATASFMQTSKLVSIDEIEAGLGKTVAELVRPWTMGQTPFAPLSTVTHTNGEITPVRYFGNRDDSDSTYWDQFYALMGDFVDTYRKTLRVLETQYKVTEERNIVIDLETGDKKVLPDTYGPDQVGKLLLWGEQTGNPLTVQRRMVERIQWTTTLGDLILYDAPSFYDRYTMTGYFPYFRRGVTRGMTDDLIDPQKEKNTRRNSEIEIVSKTANGGWIYGDDALDPVQEANLKRFGSAPGVNIKYRKDAKTPPQLIQQAQPPMKHERLEQKADEDIRRISGINESALGDTDVGNQSGRAIEARQRQAVISVQGYMDNFKRSKMLVGQNHLEIIQRYYSEKRMFRITGEDGKKSQVFINVMEIDPNTATKRIINDVTVGRYTATIDDRPLSATFAAAQYEEAIQLLDKLAPMLGNALPMFAELVVGMSSMPQKDEWIRRLQMLFPAPADPGMAAPGAPPALPPGAPASGGNVVPMPARG